MTQGSITNQIAEDVSWHCFIDGCRVDGRGADSLNEHAATHIPTGAYLSPSQYATPRSISEDKHEGRKPRARMHIVIPHGKSKRAIEVPLDRDGLLTIIANAADALRLLDREEE